MKILLLGANSYVGSRIYVELKKEHEVAGTFHREKIFDDLLSLDVTDKQAVVSLIAKEKPEVIIHCANNGSRKWCDEHPEEAVVLNQEATKYVVEGANTVGAKTIYISSFAAITPRDLYGKIKKASEEIIRTTKAGYVVIQPGVVIGLSPKVKKEDGFFSSLMENIDEKKPAEYDATRQYQSTHLGHICEVIEVVLERDIWSKTIPVAVPDLKTKYEIAKDILIPFGISVKGIGSGQPVSGEGHAISELQELGLPVYAYQQIVQRTIEEIKQR